MAESGMEVESESSTTGDKVKSIAAGSFEKFKENDGVYVGYIEGSALYEKFVNDLSIAGYSFVIRSSYTPSTEASKDTFYFQLERKNGHSTPRIPFCGSPFQIEKVITLSCANGQKYHKRKESAKPVISEDDPNRKKKYKRAQIPKKIGCPGKMTVKCIRLYPEFIVDSKSHWRQKKKWPLPPSSLELAVQQVLQDVKDKKKENNAKSILRYYISVSGRSKHTHNEVFTMLGGRLHPKLGNEIRKLVQKNITSKKYIKYHLKHFVDEMFQGKDGKPSVTNSAYYPSDKIIANHVDHALLKIKQTKMDQGDLGTAIDKWKSEAPEDHFFFRPHAESADTTSSLVFCHQTKWQQRLLSRYGDYMCLLDATYKTIKYRLPFFFVVVKTNVGYCVVATFVIENATQEAVQEALEIIRSWNPEWQPQNFLTDFSECEIKALEAVFHQCKVYISSFHREQCWVRWLGKLKNETDAASLKELWQEIAHSFTEEEYNGKLEDMKNSYSWKNCESARKYFTSQWIPNYYRWVDAFYSKEMYFTMRTNNGIEAQTRLFKNSCLQSHSDKTLTGVLTVIIEEFLPNQYKNYCKDNTKLSADYQEEVPSYLHERPHQFVKHVMERLAKAESNYSVAKISNLSYGVFLVQSEDTDDMWYSVTFDPVCCGCMDFTQWMFPCKHLCAIFLYVPSWSFQQLAPEYSQSVFLTIDEHRDYETSVSTQRSTQDNADDNGDDSNDWEEYQYLTYFSDQSEAIRIMEEDISLKKLQEKLGEELKKQLQLIYLCQDKTILQSVLTDAQAATKKLQEGVPKYEGLALQVPKKRNRSKVKDPV